MEETKLDYLQTM